MSTFNQDRLVITSRASGKMFEQNWFIEIQDAILDGYRIAETNLRDDVSMRLFKGRLGRAVLYKEGTAPEVFVPTVFVAPTTSQEVVEVEESPEAVSAVPENTDTTLLKDGEVEGSQWDRFEELNKAYAEKQSERLISLDGLTTYKALVVFAALHKVEIPKTTRNPKAIKKLIKAAFEA